MNCCRATSRCALSPSAASATRSYARVLTETYFDYVIRFPRQHRRHRHDGRNPHRCRLGAIWRSRLRAARRRGHRRSLSGGNRGLCSGSRHEAGLVPSPPAAPQPQPSISLDTTARRWGIECGLRDTGIYASACELGAIHVKSAGRRDRLWLINAFAVVLLTLLGAAGELGYDRMLKTNTARAPRPLVVSSGLYALRSDPDDAGNQAASADAALFSNAARPAALRRRFRAGLINEGSLEGTTPFYVCNDINCQAPKQLSGTSIDPPQFGWDYCNPNSKIFNLFRDIFPAARCVLLVCFLSTTNTPQLAAGIFIHPFSETVAVDHRTTTIRRPGLSSSSIRHPIHACSIQTEKRELHGRQMRPCSGESRPFELAAMSQTLPLAHSCSPRSSWVSSPRM